MDIAILSPIEVEYLAVRRYLSDLKSEVKEGSIYDIGTFQTPQHTFQVVIRQTGSRNTDIALATDRIIRCFNPAIVLLVGIAGGVKDVKIGDIVVATKAYGYESGKATDESFAARPESIPYDTELIDQARSVTRQVSWQQTIAQWQKVPKVVFGPIASADKVIASTRSPEYALLKSHYNDTTALEMESIGFAKAAFPYKNVRILNIRGISDLLDHKSTTDAGGGQEMAAAHAASFAFALLEHIDLQLVKPNAANVSNNRNDTPENIPGNNPANQHFSNITVSEIRKLISSNKVKQAITQLIQLTSDKDEDLHLQVNQLSQRWNKLQREENMGIISTAEANTISNQIIYSLLKIISEPEL